MTTMASRPTRGLNAYFIVEAMVRGLYIADADLAISACCSFIACKKSELSIDAITDVDTDADTDTDTNQN